MKNLMFLLLVSVVGIWAIPKPMESVENYNIVLVHGAYGSGQVLNVK